MRRKNLGSGTVHATCVAVHSRGVLLFGESGSGKSDLALRLIDRGAILVSDDQVKLEATANTIVASAPDNIKGLLEVRGVGILKFPQQDNVIISLAVLLTDRKSVERLPEKEYYECLGKKIPQIRLHAFDGSSAIKIEAALRAGTSNALWQPDGHHKARLVVRKG